jgi:molybdate transport system regulatory protein
MSMAASSLRGHPATSYQIRPPGSASGAIVRNRPQWQAAVSGPESDSVQKSNVAPLPTLSVRIDLDTEGRIGPGKIQLLEKIQEFGSISAAGRAMNMSYKRAWDLVDEINRICRQPAVDRQTGGKNGGGAALTPFGLSLVARYRKIERDAASAVRKELQALRSDIGRSKKATKR